MSDVMARLAAPSQPAADAGASGAAAQDQSRHAQYLFLRAVLAVEAEVEAEAEQVSQRLVLVLQPAMKLATLFMQAVSGLFARRRAV